MKIRDILKILTRDGWRLRVTQGSHRQFVHPTKQGKVTVAGHACAELDLRQRFYTEAGSIDMNQYAVFIAPTRTGYSAHVPDLPGCVAACSTREETLRLMKDAVTLHLRSMSEDGDPIPEPSAVEFLGVA